MSYQIQEGIKYAFVLQITVWCSVHDSCQASWAGVPGRPPSTPTQLARQEFGTELSDTICSCITCCLIVHAIIFLLFNICLYIFIWSILRSPSFVHATFAIYLGGILLYPNLIFQNTSLSQFMCAHLTF